MIVLICLLSHEMGLNMEWHGIEAKRQRFKIKSQNKTKFSRPYAVASAVQYSFEVGTSNAYFESKQSTTIQVFSTPGIEQLC